MMNISYLKTLLKSIADIMKENKDHLIALDSVVGDGDLGLTMSDGFAAAYKNVKESQETDAGKLLYMAGKAMSTAVPSTMGTLMASGLMQAGKGLKGKTDLQKEDLATLFLAYEEGVANRGKAKIGEKTFLDGLHPANVMLKECLSNGNSLLEAAKQSAQAAMQGYEDTMTMLAVHGRAATRGEASRTLKDPGAYVAALIMQAFVKSLV